MLELKGINAGYGELHVLFDITANIKEKEITVLVGPNGSGKSTLLKSIMGLTKIYSGNVILDGKDITRSQPHRVARLGLAYLPQVGNVFANLTVRENLLMAAYILSKDDAKENAKKAIEQFRTLEECLNRKAGTLSGGERQMLAMAMALTRKPKIMLFDEPTASLAPKIALEVLKKVVDLRDNYGMTIMLAEQNAKRALEHGNQAILLISGRVAYEGGTQELLEHPDLGQVYLGIKPA